MKNLEHILEKCRASDQQCQELIYNTYRGFAFRVVFRYIYRYEEATDTVTDGFLKVFTHLGQFAVMEEQDTERVFLGWLKRIMVNTAIDRLRKKSLLPEIGGIPEEAWEMPDDQRADQLMLYKELVEMIKSLPPAYRLVFNMFVIDGYTHAEIARALDIPAGTSKSNLSKARSLLQLKLKKSEEFSHAALR